MLRVLIVLIALIPTRALAGNAEDLAASDALFDEAKRLVAQGDFEQACPKFEASLKLVVRLGAKLNLADCYEKVGRTASAWAAFREATALAAHGGDASRESFARQRAAALEPYLAKLAIKVAAKDRVAGLTITRDGVLVPEAVFDISVPVDPGAHTIQATAAGFQDWSQKVTVVREKTNTIEVPHLAPAPVNSQPIVARTITGASEDQPPPPPSKTRKIVAFAIGGTGVVALAATVAIGLAAKSKWSSAATHCDAENRCDPTGLSINQDARALGNVATVTFVVGLAAVATGVVLYVTAPKSGSRERAVSIAPVLSWHAAGIALEGNF